MTISRHKSLPGHSKLKRKYTFLSRQKPRVPALNNKSCDLYLLGPISIGTDHADRMMTAELSLPVNRVSVLT